MRVMIACGLLLFLALSTVPRLPEALETQDIPPGPGHEKELLLEDLSSMLSENLFFRQDGSACLARQSVGELMAESTVSTADSIQEYPRIAVNSKDEFIVAWIDQRKDAGDIYAQFLDSRGIRLGGEIPVCIQSSYQRMPAVAVTPLDDFIVAWEDFGDRSMDIHAQRVDSAGRLLGGEIVVTSGPDDEQVPSLGTDSKGNFLVAWMDTDMGQASSDIRGQFFDPSGNSIGQELVICNAPRSQCSPAVAVGRSDEFMVAWEDLRDGQSRDIFAQVFSLEGKELTEEVQITSAVGNEMSPRLAPDRSGILTIAWEDDRAGFLHNDIMAIRFTTYLKRLSGEIPVATGDAYQGAPDVAVDHRGRFIVCWMQTEQVFVEDTDIYARIFDSSGSPQGSILSISSSDGSQYTPSLAADSSGGFAVVWDDASPWAGDDVLVRKYNHPVLPDGWLASNDIQPANLFRWTCLTACNHLSNPHGNTLAFEISTDGGGSWMPVPSNGSLEAAGSSPSLRLRVHFGSTDSTTSPLLFNITLDYIVNQPPQLTPIPDQTAWRNSFVTLTARVQDADQDDVECRWTLSDGPSPIAFNVTDQTIQFRANRSGVYNFSVSVTDGFQTTGPCRFVVTVVNHIPTISCKERHVEVESGHEVRIDATVSDLDRDGIRVQWTQLSGSHRYIDNWSSPNLRFIATHSGRYSFCLTANDGELEGAPALVEVTVQASPPVRPPEHHLILVGSAIIVPGVIATVAHRAIRRRRSRTGNPVPTVQSAQAPSARSSDGPDPAP